MYRLSSSNIEVIEPIKFSELNMIEGGVEELLRKNI